MISLLDLLKYEFHLGKSGVVLTPKAVLLAIVFIFTWLLLKLIRRIVSRALDIKPVSSLKESLPFFNYFIYTIVTLVAFDTVGLNLTTIFAASAALLVGVGLALQTFYSRHYFWGIHFSGSIGSCRRYHSSRRTNW